MTKQGKAGDILPIIRNNVIAHDNHVYRQKLETAQRWMLNHMVGKVHVHSVDHKTRLCPNSIATNCQVVVDIALTAMFSVRRLLDDRVHVSLEGFEKTPLE